MAAPFTGFWLLPRRCMSPPGVRGNFMQIRECAPCEDSKRLALVLGGNVRVGSKADIPRYGSHVRFTPIATTKAKFRKRPCLLCPRKRTCAVQLGMSALGPIADIATYSITSSASNCIELGTVSLSVLAVPRLMTNSNLVGCSTGMSPGFSPLRESGQRKCRHGDTRLLGSF